MALLDVDEATERFKKKLEEGYFDDKGLSDEEIQTMMKTLVEADKEQGMNRDTLEQDPCNTCGYEEGSIYCKEHCPHEARELAKLPPVTLQPKTGRWVVDLQTATENYYICSECGRRIHLRYPDTIDNYPYCHCGAQMVEL